MDNLVWSTTTNGNEWL